MKLTVLGNSGPYPSAERPCSGYVVELNNKLIILDLGSGTLMNFQKSYNIEDISFVILSHLHFDHMSDILVLRYALQVKKIKIDLYLPKQPKN
ncbi:MAG TPA: MBL fold metallo-hydrolase, partial [Clostridia bacterium]|nr:MBL fold metallo-hydrolase [Clostridia bacterium]